MSASRLCLMLTELIVVAGLVAVPGFLSPFDDEGRVGKGSVHPVHTAAPPEMDGQGWFTRP